MIFFNKMIVITESQFEMMYQTPSNIPNSGTRFNVFTFSTPLLIKKKKKTFSTPFIYKEKNKNKIILIKKKKKKNTQN